ncbi:MAG: hypothetical protein ACW99U_15990, partial [Candidatus Thorarchaeota archaeon]
RSAQVGSSPSTSSRVMLRLFFEYLELPALSCASDWSDSVFRIISIYLYKCAYVIALVDTFFFGRRFLFFFASAILSVPPKVGISQCLCGFQFSFCFLVRVFLR